MADSHDLRQLIAQVKREHPGALSMWPDPNGRDDPEFPAELSFEAWAGDIAARFHDRFGNRVRLVVGALPFPEGRPGWRLERPSPPRPGAHEYGLSLAWATPLTLAPGHTATHDVAISNHTDFELQLGTGGYLLAPIIDHAGDVVGIYSGMVEQEYFRFELPPRSSTQVPVLVATSSISRELGYAVPAGSWRCTVELPIEGIGDVWSEPLGLTIT